MSTFLNNFFQADTATMDPIFFTPSTGIPSESKLATYMNRQNIGTSTPIYGNSAYSRLNLDSPISVKKLQVTPQSPEFIPSCLNSSPNSFYANTSSTILSSQPPPHQQPTYQQILNGSALKPNSVVLKAQQQQIQQQQMQQQQMQQQNLLIGSTNGVNGHNSSTQHSISSVTNQSFSSMITPLKNGNSVLNGRASLLRNDSPAINGQMIGPGGDAPSPNHLITPDNSPTPMSTSTIPPGIHQENVGGTIYFYPASANHTSNSQQTGNSDLCPVSQQQNPISFQQQQQQQQHHQHQHRQPSHHIYPGPASNVIQMQPKTQLSLAFFVPEEMRSGIQERNEISNLILDVQEANDANIPMDVDNYHGLYPLEQIPIHPKLPLPSSTFKATNSSSGIKYCLRRLHGFRLPSAKCTTVVEAWKKLQHSNVVQLREVFTTKAFGDNSLVLVYDYHPGSQTLLTKYFTIAPPESNGYTDPFVGEARPFSHKSNLQRTPNGPLLPETTLWAIIMQLTAGLRAIHQAGLACRTLDPTKIIVTGKRVRFSCVGISDIVHFDPNPSNPLAIVNVYQQEDLTALGKLVLALACRCLQSVQRDNVQSSIELVSRQYSSDLRNFILFLFNTQQRRSVTDLMPMIGARFYTQLDALQSQCDMQDDELSKEMENGRLYRIIVKLSCINERPDYNMDVTWSETGDRYMLKLFRDYLFHSVTDDGRPWLDHAHIVQCLNKLDAGTMERVQLMSRDEQSVLVVTYSELKNCLENAFAELVANSTS